MNNSHPLPLSLPSSTVLFSHPHRPRSCRRWRHFLAISHCHHNCYHHNLQPMLRAFNFYLIHIYNIISLITRMIVNCITHTAIDITSQVTQPEHLIRVDLDQDQSISGSDSSKVQVHCIALCWAQITLHVETDMCCNSFLLTVHILLLIAIDLMMILIVSHCFLSDCPTRSQFHSLESTVMELEARLAQLTQKVSIKSSVRLSSLQSSP